jgi:hypothetical protein
VGVVVKLVVLADSRPLCVPPVVQRFVALWTQRLPGVQYRLVFDETAHCRRLLHDARVSAATSSR